MSFSFGQATTTTGGTFGTNTPSGNDHNFYIMNVINYIFYLNIMLYENEKNP